MNTGPVVPRHSLARFPPRSGLPAGGRRRLQEDLLLRRLRDAAQEVREPKDRPPECGAGAKGGEGQRRSAGQVCGGAFSDMTFDLSFVI